MLDEASKRRPEFVEGVPIRLEDGQNWTFPKPRIEFRIRNDNGQYQGMAASTAATETSRRFGDRFWKLRDVLKEAFESEVDSKIMDAWGAIAVDLLLRNYHLTMDEIDEILFIIPGDEANSAMWDEIIRTALGIGKKTSVGT